MPLFNLYSLSSRQVNSIFKINRYLTLFYHHVVKKQKGPEFSLALTVSYCFSKNVV